MIKSSVLSRAGKQSLATQLLPNKSENKFIIKNQQHPQYLKSSISGNLLQYVDQDQTQIQGYQSKYVDQEGNQIDQIQANEIKNTNYNSSSNKNFVKKDKNAKNRFVNQPIFQENLQRQDENYIQSPIKQLSKDGYLSSSQYTMQDQSQGQQSTKLTKPENQLKKYKNSMANSNKYDNELVNVSRLKQKSKIANLNKPTYLTNAHGIKEEQFYKLDYMNTGNFATNKLGISKQGSASFLNPTFFSDSNSELDSLQDILSDIKTLNKSSQRFQFENSKISAKNLISSGFSHKYKGMKSFSSFSNGLRNNLGSLDNKKENHFGGKLDDLLTAYQFPDVFNIRKEQILGHKNDQGSEQEKSIQNENGQLSRQFKVTETKQMQLKKAERQQRRKNNKFYQDVKNQIKYGDTQAIKSQVIQYNYLNNNPSKNSTNINEEMQQEIEQSQSPENKKQHDNSQVEQNGVSAQQKREQLQKGHSESVEVIDLANKLRLFSINWNKIPVIPGPFNQVYHKLRLNPSLTDQQTSSVIKIATKISSNKLQTYSIFSSFSQSQQLFGINKVAKKGQDKDSKTYQKLMNKKQFVQKWNKTYQNSLVKRKKQKEQLKLTQNQIQLLIKFDLSWYKSLVDFAFQRGLQSIIEQYKGKSQQQCQKVADTKLFSQLISQLTLNSQNQQKNKKPEVNSIAEIVTLNKLKYLRGYFSEPGFQQSSQYQMGIIPCILSEDTSEAEQKLIKNYLTQNFRGGIYFTGAQRRDNVCILEMTRNQELSIRQLSKQDTKQVWVNEKIVLTLRSKYQKKKQLESQSQTSRYAKDVLEVRVSMLNDKAQSSKDSIVQIKSYFNNKEDQVRLEQQKIDKQLLLFYTKFENISPIQKW